MKYIGILVVIALLLAPSIASAQCPTRQDQNWWFGPVSNFFFDTSCGSRSGAVGTGTMTCYNWSADQFNVGSGSVVYSMTVPSDLGSYPWYVRVYVDVSDPSTYNLNGVSASVLVRHNGSVTHSETIFIHNGNQGSLGCQLYDSGAFSASPGDTIEVSYGGANYTYGTIMRITPPIIESN